MDVVHNAIETLLTRLQATQRATETGKRQWIEQLSEAEKGCFCRSSIFRMTKDRVRVARSAFSYQLS